MGAHQDRGGTDVQKRVKRVDWKLVYNLIGLCVSGASVVISAWRSAFIQNHLLGIVVQLIFIVAVVLSAWLLFRLRQSERGVYAILEITFGLGAGVYASNQVLGAPDPDTIAKAVFATVGGIYIIVRGFDNWSLRNAV